MNTKEYKVTSFRVEVELLKEFKDLTRKTGMKQIFIIQEAMKNAIVKYGGKS